MKNNVNIVEADGISYPLELIYFKDHWGDGAWFDMRVEEEYKAILVCKVGFIVYEDEEGVVVAGGVSEANHLTDRFYIIKSCITSREVLDDSRQTEDEGIHQASEQA